MARPAAAALLFALAVALLARGAIAGDGDGDGDGEGTVRPWADVQRDARTAFKALKLPSAKKLRKDVEPQLPDGIVIESGPFDRLVAELAEPYGAQLALRESVMSELAAHPGAPSGKELQAAIVALGKEQADLAERVADVAAEYAEVFDQGYMDAGETARRTRKLAAVLVPFYRGLERRNDGLRRNAAESLSAFREGEALDWLVATARNRDPDMRAVAAEALGRVPGDAAVAALRAMLVGDSDAEVRLTALCGLLRSPLAVVGEGVVAALADAAWEVRAIAIAACARGGLVTAVPGLVEALARESGRLRTDIDDALHSLVGARYYGDVELWRRWLTDNAQRLDVMAQERRDAGAWATAIGPPESWDTDASAGDPAPDSPAADRDRGATSAFYGIATRSRRVLFVIDISRSMESPAKAIPPKTGEPGGAFAAPQGNSKLAIAVWQLHRAIDALPEDARFNVIVYSESYAVWHDGMSDGAARSKKKAHAFVDGITANGVTNICDALDTAFELAGVGAGSTNDARVDGGYAADTIYLLSDGDPNRGRLANLDALLADVVQRTRRARVVIHTVGIGEVAGSSFLQALASGTGGRYVGFE